MTTTEKLNGFQKRALRDVTDFLCVRGHYEVKQLEVTSFDDGEDVMVFVEIGLPNDEGTLAECLCREAYRFFIGKRGGLFRYGERSTPKYFKYWDVYDCAA